MKRLKTFMDKLDKKAILIVFVFITLTMAPLLFQGIICNDELQTRYLRSLGMLALLKDNIQTAIAKGRTIGGFVDVREISFLSNNMYVNRLIDILLILMAIGLFMYLIYSLNQNWHFSCFLGIMLMACLPVAFEHGAPNAFVAITVIPLMLVISSLLLFWKYLNGNKKRNLVFSMLLYLIAMMQYEFIVTYVLLMYLLILKFQRRKGRINWKKTILQAVPPTIVAVCYVAAYFVMQHFHASNYSGNTIGFVSVKSSLKIVYVLAKSSIPGYFLFNDKYRHLEQIYSESFEYRSFLKIIIFLIVCLFAGIVLMIVRNCKIKDGKRKLMGGGEMAAAAAFMVLPSLPNAISSLYQGTVTETFFTWLPVSIFLYFASVFLICSIIWNILRYMNRFFCVAGILCIACLAGRIQYMNYINANQQHNDFTRLQTIENFFDLQLWSSFNGCEIYSEDLYETRNLLAVNDMFWSYYLQKNGCNVSIKCGSSPNGVPSIYFIDDEYFVLTDGKTAIVCSDNAMKGEYLLRVSKGKYVCAEFEEKTRDNGNYIYCFNVDGAYAENISLERAIEQLL